ncbi:MAG: extracellular solute-binding protein [Caldilineaceae bacterium]
MLLYTARIADQRHTLLCIVLCLISSGATACARWNNRPSNALRATPATVVISATSSPDVASFWQQAAKPFAGLQLHGITEDSQPSLYIRDVLAPAFAAETGIQVDLEISNNNNIEQVIAAGGEAYDFVYVEQDVIYGYLAANRLVDITQLLDDHPALVSPTFNPNDFTSFLQEFMDPATAHLYGVPIEAFIKVYLYRTDLFADLAIRQQFAATYHYPLAPAVTFDQYRDIAAFFTRYGQEHNLPLWGTTVQATTTGVASFYEFFETIAPAFGIYDWGINLENYRATVANGGQLDSDQAIAALAFWLEMLAYAPPDARNSNWTDVANTFAAGKAAQGWIYGENVAWIATDSTRSQVVDKIGVALPPTAPGVMEDVTIGVGYLGYYDSAAFGIPINSQQQAAALLWLQYLGQPAIQPAWAINSGRVVHLSTFDDPLVQAQDRRLHGYYTLMKSQGQLFAGAPRFPFHAQMRDVIMPFLHQAILGELTPDVALHQAALAADAELVRLGYGQ